MISAFKRVTSQVKYLWNPEGIKLFAPYIEFLGPLLSKDYLPITHPHGGEQAVITPIIKGVTRAVFNLAGEVRQKIVAIEMIVVITTIDGDTGF